MDRIRVLVADDDPGLRETLIELIGSEPSLDLVGVAENAGEAIDLAERYKPEVALVDVSMPDGGGARVARALRTRSAGTRVIALSAHEERDVILHLLGAGVAGYLVKGAHPDEILEAIRECVEGGTVFSGTITDALMDAIDDYLRRRQQESTVRMRRSLRTRRFIEGDGLTMAFQPIVDLRGGEITGVEALARFTPPPDWGPTEWFHEAEAVGLRVELELAALARCLGELAWLPDDWFLSVNLSPDAVTSEEVVRTLSDAPADRIIVEITEHARVADYGALLRALADFRSRGGRLAIDDAGAGFASLRHVLVLAPEVIKLDMSLTQGIDRDRNRRALASAMITFASEIGAVIVAEGIETPGALETLRTLGARFGQGFLLGRPRPLLPGEDAGQAFHQTPPSAA
jgi:EAL domain-containing protein (putative c-di-GMP-specific phosphodiesterase class I)/CheY-like chemotaxis protein